MQTPCLILNCEAPQETRQLCHNHYARLQRFIGTGKLKGMPDLSPEIIANISVRRPGIKPISNRRADCHPERKYHAMGLCERCYASKWNKEHPGQSWRKRNPEGWAKSRKKSNLKKNYGMTMEQFNAMVEAQGGKCANRGCASGALAVDHDHSTGRVRGLLCHRCNRALGQAQDNRKRLAGLIEYLDRQPGDSRS